MQYVLFKLVEEMEGKKYMRMNCNFGNCRRKAQKKSGVKMIRICASKITGTRSWFQYYLVSSIGLPLSPPPSVIKKYYLLTVSLFLSWQQMTMKKTTIRGYCRQGKKMKIMNLVMKNWSIKFSSVLQLVEDLLRKELQEEQEGTLLLRLRNPGN